MVDWQAIWMVPVDKAVAQMVKAILKRKNRVFYCQAMADCSVDLKLMPRWIVKGWVALRNCCGAGSDK